MHFGVGRASLLLCWRPPPCCFGLIYRRQDTAPAGEETPHRVTAGSQWVEGFRGDVKMDRKSVFDARTKRKSYTRREEERASSQEDGGWRKEERVRKIHPRSVFDLRPRLMPSRFYPPTRPSWRAAQNLTY